MSLDQRQQQGRALLEAMLGEDRATETLEHWEKICPAFGEYVEGFVFGEIWNRPGLDRRTKSLITIAVTAALGRQRAMELNIQMAEQAGCSKEEVTEALLQVAPYAGFPAAWEGLAAASRIFADEADESKD